MSRKELFREENGAVCPVRAFVGQPQAEQCGGDPCRVVLGEGFNGNKHDARMVLPDPRHLLEQGWDGIHIKRHKSQFLPRRLAQDALVTLPDEKTVAPAVEGYSNR